MKVKDLWELTRFEHSIMLAIAVVVGEVVTLRFLPSYDFLLLSVIPPMLASAASFAINDYFDLRSDRINRRRDRPLVSGKVKPQRAYLLSIALFISGILVSLLINLNSFILVVAFSILAYLYSFRLKDVALLGNIYIAATMAIPFLYGGVAVADELPPALLVLSSIAFVSGLAREVMGAIRDVRGDRRGRKSKTLPMVIGARNSLLLSSLLYIASIALSVIPYAYIQPYAGNILYIIPTVITDVLLAYIALNSFRDTSAGFMKSSRNISLAAMFVALLGFLAAPLV